MNQPKAERPSVLKRAPRPAVDEKIDPVDYRVEVTPPPAAVSPAKRARRAPTVPFSTRITADVSELIDRASAQQDMTIRAVVEHAIHHTYGQ